MAIARTGALGLLGLILTFSSAQADLSISNKPTQNMSCEAGVCTATAREANLNVGELTGMLATGDTTVETGGGALDILVRDGFSWSSTSRLTTDAEHSMVLYQPVTVAGAGAFTIAYNDGGSGGDLFFFDKGKVYFQNLSSNLVINNVHYTLVDDIATLAEAVAKDRYGTFALTEGYDASADGFSSCPVEKFHGIFEGLGHHIQNVTVETHLNESGFFCHLAGAVVRDLELVNIKVNGREAGALAGQAGSHSSIIAVSASGGRVKGSIAGGLVGFFSGSQIHRSHTSTVVIGNGRHGAAGGLIGDFYSGSVDQSYATGTAAAYGGVGGLAGRNFTSPPARLAADQPTDQRSDHVVISNSYANGTVTGDQAGGIIGFNDSRLENSYSLAKVKGSSQGGGLIGFNNSRKIKHAYWDVDTSRQTEGCGGGDCSGATGLTDAQLKSGLPEGFDPKVWSQSPDINNGYPYLLANPPQ